MSEEQTVIHIVPVPNVEGIPTEGRLLFEHSNGTIQVGVDEIVSRGRGKSRLKVERVYTIPIGSYSYFYVERKEPAPPTSKKAAKKKVAKKKAAKKKKQEAAESSAPAVQEPAVQEPEAQEPVEQEPAAEEPAVQEPEAQEPEAQEPETQEQPPAAVEVPEEPAPKAEEPPKRRRRRRVPAESGVEAPIATQPPPVDPAYMPQNNVKPGGSTEKPAWMPPDDIDGWDL